MKTSNRVRSNPTTNRIPSQVQPSAQLAICREAFDAFTELDDVACAAIALAILNARQIKRSIQEMSGWSDLESTIFKAGSMTLVQILVEEFRCNFQPLENAVSEMGEKIEAGNLAGLTEPKLEGEIEYFVHAVDHLLQMQGNELDTRNGSYAYGADIIVRQRLNAAFDRMLKAYHALISFVRANNGEAVSQAA